MTISSTKLEEQIASLKEEVAAIRTTLVTLISWIPQSANSPLRVDEATELLKMLQGKK